MAVQGCLLFCLLLSNFGWGSTTANAQDISSLNRTSFPKGFWFGIGSASYQYEGAVKEGGRGPSNWDKYTHEHPERILDGGNGDVANDFYHRYKDDIKIIKQMGLDAFRISIAWPRVLPKGKLSGGVNEEGIKFYNSLIDELLSKGITPLVTLFHWDLPQALEDQYRGFLGSEFVNDFVDYANLCFQRFGDRIKYWATINEPAVISELGYAQGLFAPGRCTPSSFTTFNCTGGDSGTEPYIVAHHLLLAHASAANLYRTKYQATQKGKIGIVLSTQWNEPYSNSKKDREAAKRAMDFQLGWFMEPLTRGFYPQSMRTLVGDRLPKITKEQSKLIKGSVDFFGINYYSSSYAVDVPRPAQPDYNTDGAFNKTFFRNGVPIGKQGASPWLYVYPRGIYEALLYIKRRYNPPVIYITENGVDEKNDPTKSLEESLIDDHRIDCLYGHLSFLKKAIDAGVNVRGYFAWTLLDDFEWPTSYTVRFGFNFVDFKNGLKRYPKKSATWYKQFLSA